MLAGSCGMVAGSPAGWLAGGGLRMAWRPGAPGKAARGGDKGWAGSQLAGAGPGGSSPHL